jgi:hypothetical protein
MGKAKNKLSSAQKRANKRAKAERQKRYQWIFRNGKQVKIKRPATVDGIPVDQFIEENADPIWLHQNEMWELIPVDDPVVALNPENGPESTDEEDDIPF